MSRLVGKIAVSTLISIMFLSSILFTASNFALSQDTDSPEEMSDGVTSTSHFKQFTYTITYLGKTLNPDLTVTFRYKVKCTDGIPINYWILYSPCFKAGALVSVSEPYVYRPRLYMLKFTQAYPKYTQRIVSFTLKLDYKSIKISLIPFTIKGGPNIKFGWIKGPVYK